MTNNAPLRDYYAVLGVPRGASDREIKEAFRKLAKENHPDNARDEADKKARNERFAQISEAYNALGAGGKNKEARETYDRFYDQRIQAEKARRPEAPEGISQTPPEKRGQTLGFTIRIPENDLGLLAALVEAYKSEKDGTWKVIKSERDTRNWMPEIVYIVTKEGNRVGFRRTIKDWYDRKDDRYLNQYFLYGEGKSSVGAGYYPPPSAPEYFFNLNRLAHKLAQGIPIHTLREEMGVVNRYTTFSPMIEMEGSPFKTGDKEPGREIPLNQFNNELNAAKVRVERVGATGKEGQAAKTPGEVV